MVVHADKQVLHRALVNLFDNADLHGGGLRGVVSPSGRCRGGGAGSSTPAPACLPQNASGSSRGSCGSVPGRRGRVPVWA